jgi:hypothetical protein
MKTPLDNSVIAQMAREHGPRLIEQAIKVLVAGAVVQDEVSAEQQAKKPSLGRRIASAALVRVATRSVPGAIIVSGGLIAKALHDRHKAKLAPAVKAGPFGSLRK